MGKVLVEVGSLGDDVTISYDGDILLEIDKAGTDEAKVLRIIFPDYHQAQAVIALIDQKAMIADARSLVVDMKIRPGSGETIIENGVDGLYPSGFYGVGIKASMVSWVDM